MHGAGSGDPARDDLCALGHERYQELRVLIVDVVDLLRAEFADLAPPEHRPTRAVLPLLPLGRPAATTAARTSSAVHRTSSALNRSSWSSSRSSSKSPRCPSPG